MKLGIVKQVIEDIELEQRGATLYYALDPYDIVSYCFPIRPGEHIARNLDAIADEQTALYEIASVRTPPPIVLEEYADEIDSIFQFLEGHIRKAYDQTAEVAALIKQVGTEKSSLADAILRGVKQKEDETGFNVVLAVVLGIYRLGTERFQELFERISMPKDQELQGVLWELAAEYTETDRTEWLKETISHVVPKNKQASAEDDARAIDRLFFLNDGLEQAYLNERLRNRHILLYLSSAGRSADIFRLPEVQARLPIIDGKRFFVHRLPEHVFTRLINSGPSTNPIANYPDTLRQLREVEDTLRLDRVNRLNRKFSSHAHSCAQCLLVGGPEPSYSGCPYLTTCRAMYDLSERWSEHRARTVQNLSLMSTAQQYLELRSVHPGSPEARKFLDFFLSVADDTTVRARNNERIVQVNRITKFQIQFRNFLPSPRQSADGTPSVHDWKFMHLFAPLLKTLKTKDRYRDVSDRLTNCENARLIMDKLTYYEEALKSFARIDAVADSERVSEEHELVRSIVYLECPTDAGSALTFEHAQKMLDNYKKYKREFWLILALIAPDLRRFDDGEWYANQGLDSYPDDPRLHYARGRNQIVWIRTFPDHPEYEQKRQLAIYEQRKCIELSSAPDSPYPYLRALGYNNLAAYYCPSDLSGEVAADDLRYARQNIDKLKGEIPKKDWPDEGIIFFHTEALIEWYEAAAFRRSGELEKARFKLSCAEREIEFALERRPKEMYKKLDEKIKADMEALSRVNVGTAQDLKQAI